MGRRLMGPREFFSHSSFGLKQRGSRMYSVFYSSLGFISLIYPYLSILSFNVPTFIHLAKILMTIPSLHLIHNFPLPNSPSILLIPFSPAQQPTLIFISNQKPRHAAVPVRADQTRLKKFITPRIDQSRMVSKSKNATRSKIQASQPTQRRFTRKAFRPNRSSNFHTSRTGLSRAFHEFLPVVTN